MNHCKRVLLWFGAMLLSVSLSGCFEVKNHLKVFPSGEAEMVTTVDTSRVDEIGKSFSSSSSPTISCEKLIEKLKRDPKWSCEQTAPSILQARRHYSQDEAAAFMKKSDVLFARTYQVFPSILIGRISEDDKEVTAADTAKVAILYKSMGIAMTLELEMPGEIVAIGNNKPASSSRVQTIDLLDPLVWTDGYSVKSEEWSWVQGLGLVILAALVLAAGFFAKRKASLPETVRKLAIPVSLISALLIVILPTLFGSFSTLAPAQTEKSAPVTTAVHDPVPPPPEAVEAPPIAPLASTSVSNWRQYIDQHPVDVMEDAVLMPRFKQTLGSDYDAVKNAVATSSPTELDAGYLIASGNAPHSGGMDTAIIGIDTQNGQMYAVWKLDSQIKVYGTPHEQRLPARLYRWYKEMGGPN